MKINQITMNLKILLLTVALILIGCNNPSGKTNAQDKPENVNYESYYNQLNDYQIDYPDFLIPQGESSNQDGQKFISADGARQMWVYIDHKMNVKTGDTPSIKDAFIDDQQGKKVIEKQLFDNYYTLKWAEKDMLHTSYTIFEYDSYFTILFIYPKSNEKQFQPIITRVTESFSLGVGEEGEDPFVQFLYDFLNDCYWDKNFNTLLYNNDKVLAKYIDPKMDVIRYYNPGAIAELYRRTDNFGFDEYTDLSFAPMVAGALNITHISDDQSPCELNFSDEDGTILFYQSAENLPDEIINTESFELRPIKLPYNNVDIKRVYLPDMYGNPIGFYFINTPAGWKLAAVDDSLCSA